MQQITVPKKHPVAVHHWARIYSAPRTPHTQCRTEAAAWTKIVRTHWWCCQQGRLRPLPNTKPLAQPAPEPICRCSPASTQWGFCYVHSTEHAHVCALIPPCSPEGLMGTESGFGSGRFFPSTFPREWRRMHWCCTSSINPWLQEVTLVPAWKDSSLFWV